MARIMAEADSYGAAGSTSRSVVVLLPTPHLC